MWQGGRGQCSESRNHPSPVVARCDPHSWLITAINTQVNTINHKEKGRSPKQRMQRRAYAKCIKKQYLNEDHHRNNSNGNLVDDTIFILEKLVKDDTLPLTERCGHPFTYSSNSVGKGTVVKVEGKIVRLLWDIEGEVHVDAKPLSFQVTLERMLQGKFNECICSEDAASGATKKVGGDWGHLASSTEEVKGLNVINHVNIRSVKANRPITFLFHLLFSISDSYFLL
ncbi:hypothetical protein ACLOJK_006800 [Asimina triloba]